MQCSQYEFLCILHILEIVFLSKRKTVLVFCGKKLYEVFFYPYFNILNVLLLGQ